MTNLKERMLANVRINPATVRIPGGRASNQATAPGKTVVVSLPGGTLKTDLNYVQWGFNVLIADAKQNFSSIHLTQVITYHFQIVFFCLIATVSECISSKIISMLMDFRSEVSIMKLVLGRISFFFFFFVVEKFIFWRQCTFSHVFLRL